MPRTTPCRSVLHPPQMYQHRTDLAVYSWGCSASGVHPPRGVRSEVVMLGTIDNRSQRGAFESRRAPHTHIVVTFRSGPTVVKVPTNAVDSRPRCDLHLSRTFL